MIKYSNTSKSIKNNRGSITLEASILIPGIILIGMFFIWQISVIYALAYFDGVLLTQTEKISVLGSINEATKEKLFSDIELINSSENDIKVSVENYCGFIFCQN